MRLPRPFARSLSLRLLLIFVLTGLACLFLLITLSSQGLSGQWRRSIQPHLAQYVAYVQRDLGNPPSPSRADALARAVPVDIALFRDGDFVHSTDGRRPAVERLHFRAFPERLSRALTPARSVAISNDRREPVLRTTIGDWTVFYRIDARRRDPGRLDELALAVLALGTILFASWWLIRRELRREMPDDGRTPPSIALHLDDARLPMCGDGTRLTMLFRNLIRNAALHGRDDSGVADIVVSARRDGDAMCCTVADRGPGIDDDGVARVLEPFERLDASRSRRTGGVGLGLTLARRVAEAHGGSLALSATEPHGLTVIVRLPIGTLP